MLIIPIEPIISSFHFIFHYPYITIYIPNPTEGMQKPKSCERGLGFRVYWGYIGIMENKMETTIIHWGYIGIMENKMETTIVCWGYTGIMVISYASC